MGSNFGEAFEYGDSPPPPALEEKSTVKIRKQQPQKSVDIFWEKFTTKYPGKVLSILPANIYAKTKASKTHRGLVQGQFAAKSYDQAASECRNAVEKIAKECRRVNHKYRDSHFDIEWDLKSRICDCLLSLDDTKGNDLNPKSVTRVSDLFDKPQFYEDGPTASDVRQGKNANCWFLAALCALCNKQDLVKKLCVARDEVVGVYGFVFHRDGEWIQTIVDDKLYLIASDWWESTDQEKATFAAVNRHDAEEKYRQANQRGSKALYFAQCSNENETWLPLLEKGFAKAHGDFSAVEGGFTGEAIEDLTGGVTTELFTTDILDKEKFWSEEILQVNKEFLFGCATGTFDRWQDSDFASNFGARENIIRMHAYSIMEAKEIKGHRLLRVRNPWGEGEWKGAWSDGSEQWTPEWMKLLNHKFGDDGMFWISYEDLLRNYSSFDRTRLFGPEWQITQQWTTVDVPWTADYNDTKFSITLTKHSPIVIVLSQLDDRYFKGLRGQYYFNLHFRLEKEGEHDYIVRSHGNYSMRRSVSTDLELDAGTYSVLMRITALRDNDGPTPEDVIRANVGDRQKKLIQVGLSYDLAHAKGIIRETEEEKRGRKAREERKKAVEKKKLRELKRKQKLADWEFEKRIRAREKRKMKRREAYQEKKAAKTKAAEGSVADDKGPPTGTGATAAAGVEGEIEKQAAAGAIEAKAGEPASEPAALPSPPAETKTPDAKAPDSATTNVDTQEKDAKPADVATLTASEATPEEERPKDIPPPADPNSAAPSSVTAPPPPPTDKPSPNPQLTERALQSVPSVTINDAPMPPTAPSTLRPLSTADADDYQYDSDASFASSIDSVLDFPRRGITHSDDEKSEKDIDESPPAENDDDEEKNKAFEDDPWNAVCVVGLRVYSKDEGCCVEVVRPKVEEETLDLDDASKGASGEVEGKAKDVSGVKVKVEVDTSGVVE